MLNKIHNDYAVLIGVRDYRSYDPTGKSDVPGARNDALAWAQQCIQMGFSPDRILVLTSPALSPEELGPAASGVKTGEATREGIVSALTWLTKTLAAGDAVGLCTFSGHGALSQGQLLLCPSDTTPELGNVVDVRAMTTAIAGTKAGENLTLVIDGCHSQAGLSRSQSIYARLSAQLDGLSPPEGAGVAERVLSACKKDQVSVSSHFHGKPMGAFTWALTSTLGQWRAAHQEKVVRSTVSYGNLVSRSRALLSSLSFTQEPVLSGPEGVAALAFLGLGDTPSPGATSPLPNASRPARQLDPGAGGYRLYSLYCGSAQPQLFGYVIAVNRGGSYTINYGGAAITPDPVTLAGGTEYWIVASMERVKLSDSVQIFAGSDSSETTIRLSTLNGTPVTLQTVGTVTWGTDITSLPADSWLFFDASYAAPLPCGFALVERDGALNGNVWVQSGDDDGKQAFYDDGGASVTLPSVAGVRGGLPAGSSAGYSTFSTWDVTL